MTRVILADSQKLVTEGLQLLLQRAFEVSAVVSDGEALVDVADRLRPDVVVTEITLPRLNGLDAIRELRKRGNRARAVVLTMHTDTFLAAEAFRAGASGFVCKQSASEELVDAIRLAAQHLFFVSPALSNGLLSELRRTSEASLALVTLTLRQRQLLQLSAEGQSCKQIARQLDLSPRTVESHKYRLMRVLHVRTTAQLIACAARLGLIPVPLIPAGDALPGADDEQTEAADWLTDAAARYSRQTA